MDSKFDALCLFTIGSLLFQTSCTQKNTEDPIKSFSYWAGQPPTKEIRPIHGKYWEPANSPGEYQVWLEFEASRTWIINYIQENKLIECTKCDTFTIPAEAPIWFNPDKNYKQLFRSEDNRGAMYFYDTLKSKMFIYEPKL